MFSRLQRLGLVFGLLAFAPNAYAAGDGFNGAGVSGWWAAPFAGLLLSIAVLPLWAPQLWHQHFGKIAALWGFAVLLPMALWHGVGLTGRELAHTMVAEFIPFLILILALFTVAGGVLLKGNLHGSPMLNTLILAIGTALASVTGTTGAAMLLVRPIIRANDNRQYNAHVLVFFIFLVANIGGSLTPLGDPPLFLGYLKGVDFFWPTAAMLKPMLVCTAILLAVFFVLDSILFARDKDYPAKPDPTPDSRLRIVGWLNVALLGAILVIVIISGYWRPGIGFEVFGTRIELQSIARDIALLVVTWISWRYTTREVREGNGFTWGPILEVAKLFAGIFVTLVPVIAILKAGKGGAFAPLVDLATLPNGQPNPVMYFWLTGGLSSFLDNAPTYLVFFNLAGGNPVQLMGPLYTTLLAISAGAVFMGANTYIGNAPNMMVKAIAEERGVKMPSFFGYMLWSGCVLIPCFVLITWLFFV